MYWYSDDTDDTGPVSPQSEPWCGPVKTCEEIENTDRPAGITVYRGETHTGHTRHGVFCFPVEKLDQSSEKYNLYYLLTIVPGNTRQI